MSVPVKRKANAGGRRRRSHDALKAVSHSVCSQCAGFVQPHHACRACGYYRGHCAVDVSKATEKLVKKSQKKS